jgi:hypothetical protein
MTADKGLILATVYRAKEKNNVGMEYEAADRRYITSSLTREQANALSRALQCFLFDGLKEVTVYKDDEGHTRTSMFTASGEEL